MTEIETPKWNKYQFQHEHENKSQSIETEREEIEENIDDSMYAELHAPFEARERRRYVTSTLAGEAPFLLGYSSIQFLKIESVQELESTYSYPPVKQLSSIETDCNHLDSLNWSVKSDESNVFLLHFTSE